MKSVAVLSPGQVAVVSDVPMPEPGDYEALVRVHTCGFCNGTDFQVINATLPAHEGMGRLPTLLGHEGAGEVVAVGRKARRIRVGDRYMHPNLRADPGNGYTRTYGGMSDYGLVADHISMLEDGWTGELPFYKKFAPLPRDMSYPDASVLLSLTESMSAARNFGVTAGTRALVYGAGPMGSALMKYMRLFGAKRIVAVDRDPARLMRAAALCEPDGAIDSSRESVADYVKDERFDLVVDAVGLSSIIIEGSGFLKPGGRVGSMGVLREGDTRLDVTRLKNNTLFQLLNLPFGEYDLIEENIALIRAGKINPGDFYSHILPRSQIHFCMELVRTRQAIKVILTMDETEEER